MSEYMNQAVVFTKPIHHLALPLTPDKLAEQTKNFLEKKGFKIIFCRKVSGAELAKREIIRQHYLMYSRAACVQSATDELVLSEEAQKAFECAFGKSWQAESNKVLGSPMLQQTKGISAQDLFLLWNEQFSTRKTQKIQDGVIIAQLESLNCYCINAFYPAMEENFYHPKTEMTYYVVEFDAERISWENFRKVVLGVTDASQADPESLRGTLYAAYGADLDYPGRDNFVHGSAGPFESWVERAIHEPNLDIRSSSVGRYLLERGMDLNAFKQWKLTQSIAQLGQLFDATEEKDTAEVLDLLAGESFSEI